MAKQDTPKVVEIETINAGVAPIGATLGSEKLLAIFPAEMWEELQVLAEKYL